MARCPFATWRGSPNFTPGGMIAHPRGLIFHVEQGTEVGTIAVFGQPSWQASAHFGNPKVGPLDQFVDTSDMAWAQAKGNPNFWSVENEGNSGEPLNDNQVANLVQLIPWLRAIEPFPLQLTDDPNGSGLGWHGMGGNDWGGHFDCPGESIKAQRQTVIDLIQGGLFAMLNDAEQTELLAKVRELHQYFLEPVADVGAGVPWAVDETLNDVRAIKAKLGA